MQLRDYQQRAINQLYEWFRANPDGNPCLVLPTGAGKSHIVAALCKNALQSWPDTRVLMLTHQKELIEQNAEKLRQHWPGAPMGIYSASVGKRQAGEPITFAGIQSVRSKPHLFGRIDLVIIDECFVAGTKISTPTGYKDIDLVRCGDSVYNAQGVGVVLGVSAKPSQDIYKLEFSDGTTIECTGSHPFFTEQGWKQARELENGTHFFSIEGLRMLWSSVSALDQTGCGNTENHFGLRREDLERAKMLLSVLCQEIEKPNGQPSVSLKNESEAERDKAQAHKAWRERAIAAFTSVGPITCPGGWMGSGVGDSYKNAASWIRFSNLLQSGFGKPVHEASHRVGRRESLQLGEKSARFEENRFFDFPRLERISCVESAGSRTVFNLRISGHPSYFANGKLVHNCHTVSHKDEGGYRTFISALSEVNPALRVVGLTATPYRLGHGYITDKPAIFDALIEPVSIEELVLQGHLCILRSKSTSATLSVDGVKKRGGEYIESELQAAVNTDPQNAAVVQEVLARADAENRKTMLFFCTGVDHSMAIRDLLRKHGQTAECVTGKTPKAERARILQDFKVGKIRCLTNANVLSTGFDAPNIDLIAMLRPTLSPGLYLQCAGRGLRIHPDKDDCLILDFAGVVAMHGPVTAVQPPKRKGEPGGGEAPTKGCPECGELIHASVMTCPACGHVFEQKEKPLVLRNDDIMGIEAQAMHVTQWNWRKHTSRSSGKDMLAVTYYGALSDIPVTEYLPVCHDGFAGQKAMRQLVTMERQSGAAIGGTIADDDFLDGAALALNQSRPPAQIEYRRDGKFFRVLTRRWENAPQAGMLN